MKNIKELVDLNGRRVLLRLDLNVPLKDNEILDSTRIDKIFPTLEFLINKNCKIIIISHIGRPKGKVDKKLSMLPVCKYLSNKLNKEVQLIDKMITDIDPNSIFKDDNKIIFLENIRFYEQEEKNSDEFAKILSNLGEIFVNDAFSCSHRAHTSIDKITNFYLLIVVFR